MDREMQLINPPLSVQSTQHGHAGSVGSNPMSTCNFPVRDYRDVMDSIPAISEKLTLAQFLGKYHQQFPIRMRVCKGFCGLDEATSISDGDQFNAHFLKYTTIIAIVYENGSRFNVPLNSAIPFAILYNPHNNINEAMKGYRFEKVSDVLQMGSLPSMLWTRKTYQGSTSDSSVSVNELLIVKKVRKQLLGKQQLKVYSLTAGKEKTLNGSCAGNFSTKPRDICLYLPEILKHLPDIYPCKAVLFSNQSDSTPRKVGTHQRTGSNSKLGVPVLVTLLHSSIETSLVATSIHEQDPENAHLLELPIDLDILVRVDNLVDEDETQRLYEDTSFIYEHFNPANLQPYVKDDTKRTQSQFYTNVNFGQERSGVDIAKPPQINSISNTSEGHYQSPKPVGKLNDSTFVESLYHPPEPPVTTPTSGTPSNGFGRRMSLESSPAPPDPTWRPPLPPPRQPKTTSEERNKDRKRTAGYSYVEAHPRSTRPVMTTRSTEPVTGSRVACVSDNDQGIPLSSSAPGQASKDSSFGSTGSGGGIVRRDSTSSSHYSGSGSGIITGRGSNPGSDSGIVEARANAAKLNVGVSGSVVQRQVSAPARPESIMLNSMIDDLDQLARDLDICPESSDGTKSTDSSNSNSAGTSPPISIDELSECNPVSPEVIDKNIKCLAAMDNTQVLRLLEVMNLEKYIQTFRLQHINGDILSECDDDILTNELEISSRLHRLRLMKIISGQYSVLDIMSGQDGYVLMLPGK